MKKNTTKEAIIKRINALNKKIDLSIINGTSYKALEVEHYNLYLYLKNNF